MKGSRITAEKCNNDMQMNPPNDLAYYSHTVTYLAKPNCVVVGSKVMCSSKTMEWVGKAMNLCVDID